MKPLLIFANFSFLCLDVTDSIYYIIHNRLKVYKELSRKYRVQLIIRTNEISETVKNLQKNKPTLFNTILCNF